MKRHNTKEGTTVSFSREELESLQVGDLMPNCFGRWMPIVSITYSGIDVHGKYYVGVYLENGGNSSMSDSYKEDVPQSTVGGVVREREEQCLSTPY